MVPNNEKLLEAFIGGLPRSIEENVTASKPQTLEEAINISQRLMDQIIKRDSVQLWRKPSTKTRILFKDLLYLCEWSRFHETLFVMSKTDSDLIRTLFQMVNPNMIYNQ
ncbi:hypothetical protein Tco_0729482 [Tanacetum coccineum]|uniref:Uncharacterized protein n=1 Tax=Tanacetum coccineum TaxID=301880 RepID=A0ABQ4YQ97_9ASTR